MSLNQFENEFKMNTETMVFYCISGFYTLLAFQRHFICNFWTYGLKDMNFERFSTKSDSNSNSNSILNKEPTCGRSW
jgi:hypothetical protein